MDWMELARDTEMWRGLVIAVMNFLGSINWVEFLD